MSDTTLIVWRHLQRALSDLETAHLYMKSLGLNNELEASDEEQWLWEAVESARRQVRIAQNRFKELIP